MHNHARVVSNPASEAKHIPLALFPVKVVVVVLYAV
jgi:hypothetical protein